MKAINDYVLITPVAEDSMTEGGVMYSVDTSKNVLKYGKVSSIGPAVPGDSGLAEGDTVLYPLDKVWKVSGEEDSQLVLKYSDLMASN